MKKIWSQFTHFIFCLSLMMSSSNFSFAQTDSIVAAQQAECAKNSAMEWSNSLNRCVGKKEAVDTRHTTQDCTKIQDIKEREKCHIELAEKQTGLSSDPNSLSEGNIDKSSKMNGATLIPTAYMIIGLITSMGSSEKESTCTSKKIFGITSAAGALTDIYLKIEARKKINKLKDKYKTDVNNNGFNSQIKAFQYLKEEQETVQDIASKEKKRNMLLMLGYGAAAIYAGIELATPLAHPECFKTEAKKEEPQKNTDQEPDNNTGKGANAPADNTANASPAKTACGDGMVADGSVCVGKYNGASDIKSTPLASASAGEGKTNLNAQAQVTEGSITPPPKDMYVATSKNGTIQIRGVNPDGSYNGKAIVGNHVTDFRTGKVAGVVDVNNIEITRVGISQKVPTSGLGIYSSKATDSAGYIKFQSGSGPRTTIKGTTTIIRDKKR